VPGASRLAAVACGDGSVALLALDEKGGGGGGGAASAWALTAAAGGHSGSACVAVRFPAFAAGAPLLVSGGIDGRVLLWDWGEYVGGGLPAPILAASAANGGKINWLATGAAEGGGGRVYAADTSRLLAEYAVR